MNEEALSRALRAAAGSAPPSEAVWEAIVTEGERRRTGPAAGVRRLRVVAAIAATVALVAAGATAALQRGGEGDGLAAVRAGVPSVSGGSSDLIVESGTLSDTEGRTPVVEAVAADVSTVEGVDVVAGVVRTVARFSPVERLAYTPSVVVSWDGGDGFELREGRAPEAPGEVALTPLAAERLGVAPGDHLGTEAGTDFTVVGTFDLPGGGPEVVLAAVALEQARTLAGHDGYSRLHVQVEDGADPEEVRAAVAAAPPGSRVVGVHQLGTTAQLRDELEIQQAYFDIMHPDPAVRMAAVDGAVDTEETRANYARLADQAAHATLRIQRYVFLDTDHVQVVYTIYYGDRRSPVVPDPQTGQAVRTAGRWKQARATLCQLAGFIDQPCLVPGAEPARPPAGWDDPASAPGAVAALRVLADPRSSLEERLAVAPGADRAVVGAGLARDQGYAGAIAFHVSGVRREGNVVEVLYAVQADGDPPLETPYPLEARLERVGGGWVVDPALACGLAGLVHQECPPAAEATTTASTFPDATTAASTVPEAATTTLPEPPD